MENKKFPSNTTYMFCILQIHTRMNERERRRRGRRKTKEHEIEMKREQSLFRLNVIIIVER